MEILVTVCVIAAMIALGMLVIHQLNAQHEDRIALFPYGRSRRGGASPARPSHPAPDHTGGRGAGHSRRDHRDGGRGRFRARRRARK
ncbi:hypothetical protein H8N01_12335 [Streptomyces sp. AC536]|uniref:hypothetical protein n=1 Tax=Streptomyces buecherae TaxID=2763006 RepID=UPI00164CF630|nr:hypothetical protein [Streptomyces buecherae]MBC3983326.1 hypothetical protein [Streptomyces buecherae]QNJ41412.1 hypothetical protein H7H31_17620 [Streptomyces buecherae]